ncbi:MAG: glycosyl hydrolase, partial [Acidobacteria bacterium]|nr:glycosyl hydrolase [Acidobacteriota bacterium]
IVTVTDQAGQVVRRLTGPVSQGMHRVAWDLRYPPVDPTELEEPVRESWESGPVGPLVVPGTFTVSIAKRIGGVVTPLAEPQTLTVESLHLATLDEKNRQALLSFQQRAGALQRAMMGASAASDEALRSLQFMKKAVVEAPKADATLASDIAALERRLRAAGTPLAGDRVVRRRSEASLPSLMDRVSAQLGSTSPITDTVKRDYDIAAAGFEKLLEDMRVLIEVDLRKLGERLEAAGAPWTPGRGVPRWKK